MKRRQSAVGAAVAGVALAVTAPAVTPAAQAAYESDYATRTVVTFGASDHGVVPVTLELPAPASGGAVTGVGASWQEVVPQELAEQGNKTVVHTSLDASACTADATCTVHAALPTVRMANGTVGVQFVVGNADGEVSLFSRSLSVQNPKPTVDFVSPQQHDAVWGDVTISADAATSTAAGAAPLKGVRFYVDGNLGPDAPYLFDDTAPYAVTVAATDIAPVQGSRYLVVVAEDADGNLSQMPVQAQSTTARRLVSVGPPPSVAWTSPTVGGLIDGSMRRGVPLDFHAELPDTVPARPGDAADPYIAGYDVALDGVAVGTSSWADAHPWNDFTAHKKMRTIDAGWGLSAAGGLTPGRHVATVRVRTSYGSVATLTSDILVADGVRWGAVRSGGHVVRDGWWVTAGTLHRFTVPVATKVSGTRLAWVNAQEGHQALLYAGWPCAAVDLLTCPESTTVRTDLWAAPPKPGKGVLQVQAQIDGDAMDTLTRTIRVQPAALLSLDVSTHAVRAGRVVRFTGRLTRSDTRAPQAGRTVLLQWRRPNVLRWFTVAKRVTGSDGVVRFRARPTASGYYRLRSPQVLGSLGPGLSTEEQVTVRR